jgi:cobalt/nickel transport system permease protein
MSLNIHPPGFFSSPLNRLDARWKLAALVPAVFGVACLRHVAPALMAMALAFVLAILARVPGRWFWTRVGSVALLIGLFVIWLPLTGREPFIEVGPILFSSRGLEAAAVILAKSLAVISLVVVLWTTAPMKTTLKAAHALHAPRLLVQLLAMTYRYVFLFVEELTRLRIALRVRGFRQRADLHSLRTIGHVAGSLLVRSYERAERVSQAMRCRGFDGQFRSLTDFETRAVDIAFFVVVIGAVSGCLAWDWLG